MPECRAAQPRADSALAPVAFAHLPLGAVRPTGWLQDQLRIQSEGLTGHLGEVWPDCGPRSAWRGGDGEAWERGPYYLDGLVPLAHLLDLPRLLHIAEPFIEWILGSGRPDGFFGPAVNDDWWPRMIVGKILTQHAEATGDPRVAPFLLRYFRHQFEALPQRPLRDWGQARAADNVLSVFWLYERSGEPFLLDLAGLLLRQGIDWPALWRDFPYRGPQMRFDHRVHVVNVAMSLKFPAVRCRLSHDVDVERGNMAAGMAAIWQNHGQAHGMFAGDEWLAGTAPTRGVETCAVVEGLFSLAILLGTFGDAALGDRMERIAYNALPACQSPDQWLHQYDQQANQVRCTPVKRSGWSNGPWANVFGLEPNFGCCTANLHQGWPKFVSHLWGRAPDGGLAALAYGPCTVRTDIGGTPVAIEEESDYPFRDEVRFVIRPGAPELRFPLHLRVPEWAAGEGRCTVAGEVPVPLAVAGWHVIDRGWRTGDTVTLYLPAAAERIRRPSGGVAVRRGPLVFAYGVAEKWRRVRGEDPVADYEVLPAGPWNYGLLPDAGFEVRTAPVPRQPFASGVAPLRLATRGRRVPSWTLDGASAAPPPTPPVVTGEPVEEIALVPYGSARIRVTEMPEVEG